MQGWPLEPLTQLLLQYTHQICPMAQLHFSSTVLYSITVTHVTVKPLVNPTRPFVPLLLH